MTIINNWQLSMRYVFIISILVSIPIGYFYLFNYYQLEEVKILEVCKKKLSEHKYMVEEYNYEIKRKGLKKWVITIKPKIIKNTYFTEDSKQIYFPIEIILNEKYQIVSLI